MSKRFDEDATLQGAKRLVAVGVEDLSCTPAGVDFELGVGVQEGPVELSRAELSDGRLAGRFRDFLGIH
jgi:hypothetical protein